MAKVELFGQARLLAGTRLLTLPGATIGEVLSQLVYACPELAGPVLQAGGQPTPAYTLNVNGTHFTSNLEETLADGDELLLLSSLSGG